MTDADEKEQKLRERIERELTIEFTGYDILVQQKRENILELIKLIQIDKGITRKEICNKLDVSMRTASRYLSVIRNVLKTYIPVSDRQVKDRDARIKQMEGILKSKPSITVVELASRLKVSTHTVYKYMKMKREGVI